MKNVNLFNCNGISLSGEDYLYHKALPGFSEQKPFTVECTFFISKMESSETYVLYEQFVGKDGIMCLYIVDERLCFYLRGNRVKVALKKALEPHTTYTVAAVYDTNGINLYIDGINIDTDKNTEEFDESAEMGKEQSFRIGENFIGVINRLQVYPEAVAPNIIRRRAMLPDEQPGNAVLFMDFSNNQYKDISKNKMPIMSHGAPDAANFVYCTKLKGEGYYILSNKVDVDEEYFMCFNVFPLFSSRPQIGLISAYYGDGKLFYEIIGEKRQDGKYYITLKVENKTFSTDAEFTKGLWHDVSLSWNRKGIALYLDGQKIVDNYVVLCPKAPKLTTMIGKTAEGYDDAFAGYLGYAAEFNSSFEYKEVLEYMGNPPYVYDEHLKSIVLFSRKSVREQLTKESLELWGNSEFGLYPHLNPPNAPYGLKIRVPRDKDPDWDKLTEWDKEVYQTLFNLIKTIYQDTFKLPVRESARCENVYKIMKRYHEELYCKLWRGDYKVPEDAEEAVKFLKEIILAAEDFYPVIADGKVIANDQFFSLIVFLAFAVGIILAAATASFIVMAMKYKEELKKFFEELIGGIGAFLMIKDLMGGLLEKRKEDPCGVIRSINVNHNGNPKIGSIHFNTGTLEAQDQLPAVDIEKAVIVFPELDYFLVKLEAENTCDRDMKGMFSFWSEDVEGGRGSSNIYDLPARKTITVEIKLKFVKEADATKYQYFRMDYSIEYMGTGEMNPMCGILAIYALAGRPSAPWLFEQGPYNPMGNYINTTFLDVFRAHLLGYNLPLNLVPSRFLLITNITYRKETVYSAIINDGEGSSFIGFKFKNFLKDFKRASFKLNSLDACSVLNLFWSGNGKKSGIVCIKKVEGRKQPSSYKTLSRSKITVESFSFANYYVIHYAADELLKPVTKEIKVSDLLLEVRKRFDPCMDPYNETIAANNIPLSLNDGEKVKYDKPLISGYFRERFVVKCDYCTWDNKMIIVARFL